MKPADQDWTVPLCQTSHRMINGIQYTLCDYGNFVELTVYSWHTHSVVDRFYFFRCAFGKDCFDERVRFWNCGERVMTLAKHYVDGCQSMTGYRMDMSRFSCKEIEEN